MKPIRILTLLALACAPGVVSAQTVLSDFSDIAGQPSTFEGTWSGQYSQSISSITVAPSGGNPDGTGDLLVSTGVSLDLGNHSQIQFTASRDPGDAMTEIAIVFWNPDSEGDFSSQGDSRWYVMDSTLFDGGPQTVSLDLSAPTGGDAGFDPAAVNYWSIEGDLTGNDFRFTFENLQLTPVPEPATWAMLALGGGLLALRRARRK